MKPQKGTILIVDDETDLRDIMLDEFQFNGWKTFGAESLEQALKIIEANEVDVVLTDIRMPGGNGTQLVAELKASPKKSPLIFLCSAFSDISPEEARELGAIDLISKPFEIEQVLIQVEKALELERKMAY